MSRMAELAAMQEEQDRIKAKFERSVNAWLEKNGYEEYSAVVSLPPIFPQHYDRTTIKEEPIPCKASPIYDADGEQKNKYSLRSEK